MNKLPVIATDGPRWQCVACEMLQFPRARCNRCGKPFKAWALCLGKTIKVEVTQPKTEQVEPEKLTPREKSPGRPNKRPLLPIRTLSEIEKEAIIAALGRCMHVGQAATELGIPQTTFYSRLRKYGIQVPRFAPRRPKKYKGKANSTPKL